MHKSLTHFKVEHGVQVYLVPASYVTIIQSRDFETSEKQAVRLALSVVIGRPLEDWEEIKYNKTAMNDKGHIYEPGMFTVNEHSNGFSLTHNPSQENHWLSDGVDTLSFDEGYDGEEVTLHPGTLGFVEVWSESANNPEWETLEACFPHLVEKD